MHKGKAYQGVLKAVSPQLTVALALAQDKTETPSREHTQKLMQLEFADIVSVSVVPDSNPSFTSKSPSPGPPPPLYWIVWCTTGIFKTDTEISRTNGSGHAKELQVCVCVCDVIVIPPSSSSLSPSPLMMVGPLSPSMTRYVCAWVPSE